ncbi:MAG TPA: hypothetical protein VLA72_23390 [Anaerolineales bacterium]|nr:hypothetical protein [Anaerolineales bacterium]
MPKVNYKFQKRQKELKKKRKKEKKMKLKELRKLEKEGLIEGTETEGTEASENPSASLENQGTVEPENDEAAPPPTQQDEK